MRRLRLPSSPRTGARRRSGRLRSWLECTPGLRDPAAPLGATRTVSCRQCGCGLGTARDPVEVAVLAWRHRGHGATGAVTAA